MEEEENEKFSRATSVHASVSVSDRGLEQREARRRQMGAAMGITPRGRG